MTSSTIPNAPTFEDVRASIAELARTGGAGKDTQIKAALKVVEAAYHGTVDFTPNKHGPGRTDAVVLAEDFTRNFTGAMIFDTKAPTSKKLISCFNKLIVFGNTPKWGTGQPMQIVNDFLTARQRARARPQGRKLADAFNAFMAFVRAQSKEDSLMSPAEFDQFIFKPEADVRTPREVIDTVRTTMLKLQKGQVAHCNERDDSAEVQQIIALCTQRIQALDSKAS